MKQFITVLKKEALESIRSIKLPLLAAIFVMFGIMNPAIAKLTPLLISAMGDALAESGMQITEVTVNALSSWTQFFKNIPMAMIIFAIVYSSVLTHEYSSGTLILAVSKGLSRYKIIFSKLILLLTVWSALYYLSFGITYFANSLLWDNSIALYVSEAVFCQWLFGVFIIALIIFFSTVARSMVTVLLGTGAPIIVFYVIGIIPRINRFLPTALLSSQALLTGAEKPSYFIPSLIVTSAISLGLIIASVPTMNKKEL